MKIDAELNRKFPFGIDLNKILPDLLRLRMERQRNLTYSFTIDITKRSKGTVWQQFMLLINVSTKKLMKKVKNTNFTPISDVLFLRLTYNYALIQMFVCSHHSHKK